MAHTESSQKDVKKRKRRKKYCKEKPGSVAAGKWQWLGAKQGDRKICSVALMRPLTRPLTLTLKPKLKPKGGESFSL